MKNLKKIQIILCFFFLFSSLIFTKLPNSEQITIPLSNSGKPGIISLDHYKGSIKVSGYNGKTVVVNASYRNFNQTTDGMKLFSVPVIKLSATEKNNTVIITTNSQSKTIDLDISVPYNFSLRLSTDNNGEILVNNVRGEFELNNNNGNVKLINVSGSAVISTIDGDIYADFLKVSPNSPMVFTTMDGKINLSLPNDSNISFKMKTENGEIFSNFSIDINKRKTIIQKKEQTGTVKVSLDDWTCGKINKGGPEYLLKSLNGNIYIRKKNK